MPVQQRLNKGIGSGHYFDRFYSSRDWRYYRDILALIVRFSEPGPILDVGAGTGLFVECAGRWGLDCVGLEGAPVAVEVAQARCPRIQIFSHLLSEPFPFGDAEFQTVVCNQVIEHLEPEIADKCLKEICRVLRPGGMLYVASPNKFNKTERGADPTHLRLYTPHELVHLLASRGFDKIIPLNSPRSIIGNSKIERYCVSVLFKLTMCEWLSASANCIAYKSAAS